MKSFSRNFCFEIRTSTWSPDSKDFIIQASSEEEMEDWIKTIRTAKGFDNKHLDNLQSFIVRFMKSNFSILDDGEASEVQQIESPETEVKNSDRLQKYCRTSKKRSTKTSKLKFDIITYACSNSENKSYFQEPDTNENIRLVTLGNGRPVIKVI